MASLLKYLTPPAVEEIRTIGNEKTCGTIQIKIIGGLTSEEDAANVNLFVFSRNLYLAWGNLCDRLEKEQYINVANQETGEREKRLMNSDESHKALTSIIFNQDISSLEEKIANKYANEIRDINVEMAEAIKSRRMNLVTACIKSRLGYKDWTLADTSALDSEMLQAISDVLDEEIMTKRNNKKLTESAEEKKEEEESGAENSEQ